MNHDDNDANRVFPREMIEKAIDPTIPDGYVRIDGKLYSWAALGLLGEWFEACSKGTYRGRTVQEFIRHHIGEPWSLKQGQPMTAQDIREFNAYLANCTDRQVQGVYEKEKAAGRDEYVALVEAEAAKRGIVLEG